MERASFQSLHCVGAVAPFDEHFEAPVAEGVPTGQGVLWHTALQTKKTDPMADEMKNVANAAGQKFPHSLAVHMCRRDSPGRAIALDGAA